MKEIITPEWAFKKRRQFMKASALGFVGLWFSQNAKAFSLGKWLRGHLSGKDDSIIAKTGDENTAAVKVGPPLKFKKNPKYTVSGRPTTQEQYVLHYNNFYEFSLDKQGVSENAKDWTIKDWTLLVGGLVKNPVTLKLDDLYTKFPLEERVYRLRCVEAWSMVLPWIGFPLADVIKAVEPTSECKYVKMTSYENSKIMPNIKALPTYPWPYTEGLTLAEAQHPLVLLAVGLYGKKLAPQNGAPVRLVVPWKYGFKSIKSIAKIEFVKDQPKTLWNELAPDEYGFYANVNPDVPHPRWSQASERVIDGRLIPKRIPTLKFNGYEKEVAGLYNGLDLKKNY